MTASARTWLVVPGSERSRNLYRGNPEPANYTLSLASAPAYSDGGENVTITMKGWKTVGAADGAFWTNTEK